MPTHPRVRGPKTVRKRTPKPISDKEHRKIRKGQTIRLGHIAYERGKRINVFYTRGRLAVFDANTHKFLRWEKQK